MDLIREAIAEELLESIPKSKTEVEQRMEYLLMEHEDVGVDQVERRAGT